LYYPELKRAQMKMMSVVLAFAFLASANGARLQQTPMSRVAELLQDLLRRVEQDGMLEQKSFDKYACWCEVTLARKAQDITDAKEHIVATESLIKELMGDLGSLGASIEQLKSDIAQNLEAQREATELRDKEYGEYSAERTESEQCIGALEAAVGVLTGAGTGKKGFLEVFQEAQVMSVVAGVRKVVSQPLIQDTISGSDMQMVKRFIQHPENFMGHSGTVNAMQIANNPFGDYAPQSTQIQGILKGMYDAFTASLEKANAEEADQQKAFEALMATKKKELETLQLTLEKEELDEAEKTKKLADSRVDLDDTKEQLKADEEFFATTKEGCKIKSQEWSERSRLRTQEMQGITQAIQILNNKISRTVFKNATTTFLQISSKNQGLSKAYAKLQALAHTTHNLKLAKLAVQVKSGGHFDEVIASIDAMIEVLRKEGKADIEHRDRCQGAENKNTNDMEDLNHEIDKSGKSIERMEDEAKTLQGEIDTLKIQIGETEDELKKQLDLRNNEVALFRQALKDDADGVQILAETIAALSKFYKRNKIPMELRQKGKDEPEYTNDPDKAPETIWEGANYGGRKDETTGIIAILGMLREDLENEMKIGREEDAENEAEYEKGKAAAQEMLDAQTAKKIQTEKELAELKQKILDTEEYKGQKTGDLGAEKDLKGSLMSDCSWVKTHFKKRAEKRQTEIDGLQEAKGYLAGVETGDELAP
jgi:hypothetical protein